MMTASSSDLVADSLRSSTLMKSSILRWFPPNSDNSANLSHHISKSIQHQSMSEHGPVMAFPVALLWMFEGCRKPSADNLFPG